MFSAINVSYGCIVLLCGISFGVGNQNLHRDLTRATVKAVQWITNQETYRVINHHTYGLLIGSLALVGYDSQTLCLNNRNHTLKKSLEPRVFTHLTMGEMAYILIGAKAFCHQQSSNYKWQLKMLRNKLRITSKLQCSNLYQYSLGIIATLIHTDNLPISVVSKAIFESPKNCTSLNVQAMSLLSLHAISKHKSMYKILQKASKYNFEEVLGSITKKYNSKKIQNNIYGFSILAQVLADRQHSSLYYHHFLRRIQKELLKLQHQDGSFGNLITTISVLPTLATTGLVDLMDFKCGVDQRNNGSELESYPPKKIQVTYQISIPGKIGVMDRQVNISLATGLTAFDGLQLASKIEPCYEHKYVYTDWGKYVKEICKYHQSKDNGLFWLYYVNGKSSSTGLDSYELKNNDVITLSYGVFYSH